MNYENNIVRYNGIICDNQLFVVCRERYTITLNKLQTCRGPVKIIQYKAVLDALDKILNNFLDIHFTLQIRQDFKLIYSF